MIDMGVQNRVVVEVKATCENHPVFESEVISYLSATGPHMGLLLNLGATRFL